MSEIIPIGKKWTRKDYGRELSVLPNGNIRTHLDDYKKTSVSEGQYINPKNIAPTIIAGGGIKIIEICETKEDAGGRECSSP